MKSKAFKFLIFLSFLCLLGLVGISIHKNVTSIKGEVLSDNIYKYVLKGSEEEYIPFTVKERDYYYISHENDTFSLYKRSLTKKEDELIGNIDGNYMNCNIYDNYFACSNEEEMDYYSYNLKLMLHNVLSAEEYFTPIYYQGKFLKLDESNKLYDGDKLIKEFDFGENYTSFYNSKDIGDNTYLTFNVHPLDGYIYYDIKNDTSDKRYEVLWLSYDKGYYRLNEGKLFTYDLTTKEYNEYTDLLLNEYIFTYTLQDNILYYLDNSRLYLLDIVNKTIDTIDYTFDKDINTILYSDNYLYLLSNGTNNNVYVVDLANINRKSYTFDQYKEYMDNYILDKVKDFENNYHVHVLYGNDAHLTNETFESEVLLNEFTIINALDKLDIVLNKFKKDFLNEFVHDDKNGLTIYLSGKLNTNSEVDTTSSSAGYTLYTDGQYELIVDISQSGLESTFCHEIMHNIEYRMESDLYTGWFEKNPYDFEYQYSYKSLADYTYTMSDFDNENAYFVDSYAKSYPTEDIARVFERVCSSKTNPFTNYPHLLDKALYLKEKLLEEFPSLNNASVFDSIK